MTAAIKSSQLTTALHLRKNNAHIYILLTTVMQVDYTWSTAGTEKLRISVHFEPFSAIRLLKQCNSNSFLYSDVSVTRNDEPNFLWVQSHIPVHQIETALKFSVYTATVDVMFPINMGDSLVKPLKQCFSQSQFVLTTLVGILCLCTL